MSQSRLRYIVLLVLIIAVLLGFMSQNGQPTRSDGSKNQEEPSYQSKQITTLAYAPTGLLSYQLEANEVKHYSTSREVWFTLPNLLVFDTTTAPHWEIMAKQAMLANSNQLYLYGNVVIKNLDPNSQIQSIITENAQIDLDSQDIISNSRVEIIGPNLTSNGLRMHGNLKNKMAELENQVVTQYIPRK